MPTAADASAFGESGTGGADHMSAPPAIELCGVTKRYGAVTACNAVDLALRSGEIHGILGENGAGKSTLMKMLIGLVLPDAGKVLVDGMARRIDDPQAASEIGIGMVHQHFSLVEELRVWENIVLGDPTRLDRSAARRQVEEIGGHYGLDVDPDAVVRDLSAGMRERVEIIKCLRRDPRVLVFDEPTSVLTPLESEQLFQMVRKVVSEEGRTVALVSHKLDEIMHATDVITIMRRGAVVAHMPTAESDARSLARHMVGRDVSLRSESAALGIIDESSTDDASAALDQQVAPVLKVTDATVRGDDGQLLLDRLSLEVRPGEIVGVAGVEGNGQRQLGDLLSSLVALDSGTVHVDGAAVPTKRSGAMLRAGIAVIPEDRHDCGCVLDMSVAENLIIGMPQKVSHRGRLSRQEMYDHAVRLIEEFDIVCAGPDAPMWSLSGGNQQKLVLARELQSDPKILVAAQPTRGLDVGAIEDMNVRLRQVADSGLSVLLISTELEEVMSLSDRVLVLYRGAVVGDMPRAEASIEQVGLLMGGVSA